jgi:hypothetical protein
MRCNLCVYNIFFQYSIEVGLNDIRATINLKVKVFEFENENLLFIKQLL